MQPIHISNGTIAECIKVSAQIPEFVGGGYDAATYQNRLQATEHIILVAYDGTKPVGFKVGYATNEPAVFYSWMGGVLPAYRRLGIAQQLAHAQEKWAKEHGFTAITFKTRNYLTAMLIFALQNGFFIEAVEPRNNLQDNRIMLRKYL